MGQHKQSHCKQTTSSRLSKPSTVFFSNGVPSSEFKQQSNIGFITALCEIMCKKQTKSLKRDAAHVICVCVIPV